MWKTLFAALLLCSAATYAQEIGLASYYSDKYNGGRTVSGETYNRNEMVAAHKSLPFNTRVRVTRLDDNRSVVVRIIDRMPDVKGRVVDLSGRAAEQLDMLDEGTVQVRLDVLDGTATPPPAAAPTRPTPSSPRRPTPRPIPSEDEDETIDLEIPKPDPGERTTVTVTESETSTRTTQPTPTPTPPRPTDPKPTPTKPTPPKPAARTETTGVRIAKTFKPYELYHIELSVPDKTGYGVQVALLSNYENAFKKVTELQAKFFDNVLMSIAPGETEGSKIYRIILGPFEDRATANAYKRSLKKKKIDGFVVPLAEF